MRTRYRNGNGRTYLGSGLIDVTVRLSSRRENAYTPRRSVSSNTGCETGPMSWSAIAQSRIGLQRGGTRSHAKSPRTTRKWPIQFERGWERTGSSNSFLSSGGLFPSRFVQTLNALSSRGDTRRAKIFSYTVTGSTNSQTVYRSGNRRRRSSPERIWGVSSVSCSRMRAASFRIGSTERAVMKRPSNGTFVTA